MPTATDLVTDLPADFEVFGQAVDTRLKALQPGTTLGDLAYSSATANTNTRLPIGTTGQVLSVVGGVPAWTTGTAGDIEGVTAGVGISGGGTSGTVTVTNSMATAITTNGDLIYGTGSGTFTRRGIGSTGDVLTVTGGVPTWAAPSATGKTWTLLSTTSMSGSSTVTVSGISNKEDVLVLVVNAGFSGALNTVDFRINGDTGYNYNTQQNSIEGKGTYAASFLNGYNNYASDLIALGSTSSNAASRVNASVVLGACKSTGMKNVDYAGGATHGGGSGQVMNFGQGIYAGSAAVTNISVIGSASFTAGTIYVYGA